VIRDATKDDYDRMAEIFIAAFPRAHSIPDECWKGQAYRARLILPYWPVFVFESGGEIEGFISIADKQITDLFVSPSSQRRGIGTTLLQRAKELQPALELEVYSHNAAAVSFYSKAGFVVESRYEDWCAEKEVLRMKWARSDV
jgi:ribosomal protein S18 acetylase RimI-like enzyme